MNELFLVLSLVVIFSLVLVWFRLFGKNGLYCFIAIATVAANIEVLVIIRAFGLEQTLGNVLFASIFLATDILSECCGKKYAARAVWIGVAANLTFLVLSQMWLLFTPAASDISFGHISAVFSRTPRLLLASLLAYAVSQQLDVLLYHKIWLATGENSRFLWLRNNAATLISQLVNTVLFNLAAFWGLLPSKTLVSVMAAGYLIYIATSLADTPFLYIARKLKPRED